MDTTTIAEVTIGQQIWTARNLNITTYRNGEPIFQVKNEEEWLNASENKKPACCAYNFAESNVPLWGRLYNWYAVNDPRGLVPEGWHVPTEQEWFTLVDFLGESSAAYKMKSVELWHSYYNGSNQSGFNGLPAGAATYGGGFIFLREKAYFWGATAKDSMAFTLMLGSGSYAGRYKYSHELGQSVRCIKNI